MTITIPLSERPPLPPTSRTPVHTAPVRTAPEADPRIPQKFPPSSAGSKLQRPTLPPRPSAPEPLDVAPEVTGAEVETGEVVAGVGAEAAVEAAVPVVGALLAIGTTVFAAVSIIIGNDNNKREAFTQQFVQQTSKQFPNCNVVIVHPQHSYAGPQVVHQHHELPMTVGTCGYDSYCSPKGQPFIFDNQGDGGYLNWAYAGEFNRNGNTLTAVSKLPTPKLPAPPSPPPPAQHGAQAAEHGAKTA